MEEAVMTARTRMPGRSCSPGPDFLPSVPLGQAHEQPAPAPDSHTHLVLGHNKRNKGQDHAEGSSVRALAVTQQTTEFSPTGKNRNMVAYLWALASSSPGGSRLPSPTCGLSGSGHVP